MLKLLQSNTEVDKDTYKTTIVFHIVPLMSFHVHLGEGIPLDPAAQPG